MIKPNLHPREIERLQALNNLNILDSNPEKDYDEITQLASEICGTPIALVSFVDEKRQWFKSKIGIEISETSRDIAFCGHAILQDDVFVIEDSAKDARFFDNPFVTGSANVQFYAGAPIFDPVTKLPIGTICVLDHKPRALKESQIKALKALSNQINKLFELRLKIQNLFDINNQLIFLKTAFENMSEGVVIQDGEGKIIDFNPSALCLLGMSADQILGKTSMDPDWNTIREDGSDFPGTEHPAMKVLQTGNAIFGAVMGIRRDNDQTRWISINAVPLFLNSSDSASHVVATFTDITQQKITLQALIESAKMKSLGEMAAGIAHEVNNPLAIISTLSFQTLRNLKQNSPDIEKTVKSLEKIDMTIERISQIIKGLRYFSRNSESDPWQYIKLDSVVKDTFDLCLEKFIKNGVDVKYYPNEQVIVNVVAVQLSQLLLNLLNNSFDAILNLEEKWIEINIETKNELALMRVTDSGFGITKNILQKIMQPFFTTKPIGKGTGLGLSISKGIIENFHGKFYYEESKGHTSFVIELPLAPNE